MLAHHPKHFAQMGCDFSIRFGFVSGSQYGQRFGLLAKAKFRPAQAVLDVSVLRRQLHRFFDQLQRFVQADVPIRQGITQGIEGVGFLGCQGHQLTQQGLHFVEALEFFADEGQLGQQFGVVRLFVHRGTHQHIGCCRVAVFTQPKGLRQHFAQRLLCIGRFDLCKDLTCLV